MKKIKSIGAFLLACALVISLPGMNVYAEETSEVQVQEQPVAVEDTATDDQQATKQTEQPNDVETRGAAEPQKAEEQPEDMSAESISYVYVDEKTVNIPETQNIVVGFKNENIQIESAVLNCSTFTGDAYRINADTVIKNTILFAKEYTNGGSDTVYLDSITYKIVGGSGETTVSLADLSIDAEYVITTDPEQSEETGEDAPAISAYALDESGNMTELSGDETNIEETIQNVADEAGIDEAETPAANKDDGIAAMSEDNEITTNSNIVIALAAGHDNNHSGASANGLSEATLTLKVAQSCRAELEKYAGVSVYMVRDSMACPYNTSSAADCNHNRINGAKAAGAEYYIDIHFNAGGASGAEVYYPNASYNGAISNAGNNLANNILNQLSALGLPNRGAKIKDTTTGETDSAGNLADFYTTNYNCKQLGMTGIIVEHAFIDNASDAAKLKDESFLQQLGVADAHGIAAALGLGTEPIISIENKNDYDGTFNINLSGFNGGANVAVWNTEVGQLPNNLWKTTGDASHTFSVNIADYKKNASDAAPRGMYYVDVYKANSPWSKHFEVYVSKDTSSEFKVTEVATQWKYTASLTFADMPSEVTNVLFPVWSKDDQSDLKWYEANQTSEGVWECTFDINDFKNVGTYQVHAYVKSGGTYQKFIDKTTFKIDSISASGYSISNYNRDTGAFEVSVSGINSPSGVDRVMIPVWSQADQSDIVWYSAEKQSDGRYKTIVNTANHGYNVGTYTADAYIYGNNGTVYGHRIGTQNVQLPDVAISAIDGDKTETKFSLLATNTGIFGSVKTVNFAVWSEANGQDDLVWYGGSDCGNGVWSAEALTANHKTSGEYNLHVYVTLEDGTQKFLGKTTFNVSGISAKTAISDYNKDAGTFCVTVSDIVSASGVSKVMIPVWCNADQSDIMWYTAEKQSDGSYKTTVNTANHRYNVGTYTVDAYIYGNNGTVYGHRTGTQNVQLPDVAISAIDRDKTETKFSLLATNTGIFGSVKTVNFAVWSEANGQDDLVWYGGSDCGNGVWSAEALIANHKTSGEYNLHVYVILEDGTQKFLGKTTFNVPGISAKTAISDYNKDAGTFCVTVSDIVSASGVSKVMIPVWCNADQRDIMWYPAEKQSNGSYKLTVSIANHKYSVGTYTADVYMYANNGLVVGKRAGTQKVVLPEPKVTATDTTKTETEIDLSVANAGIYGAVKIVNFAVWSEANGQDDLVWYAGTDNGRGIWIATDRISNHKTSGIYNVHTYVTLEDGSQKFLGETIFSISDVSAQVSSGLREDKNGFTVYVEDIVGVSGVKALNVAVWSQLNQGDLCWYTGFRQTDGTYRVEMDPLNHGCNSGIYIIHAYVEFNNGLQAFAETKQAGVIATGYYSIMGNSTTTVQQMVNWWNSKGVDYPSDALAPGGAPDINTFCLIIYEEASYEDVKAEVAFAQSMKETGWLRFGGQVSINQYNFAGLGATDDGAAGAGFDSVRTGIRAQIQHLKAYASQKPLNLVCVDPRFHLVTRGSAPYVQWLGQKENPNGYGWATSANYGNDIANMIQELKNK